MFGFGTKKRNRPWRGGGIRIGTASYSSLMIAPSTAIGEHLILETCLAFGGGLFHDYDHVHGDMASISLHYRFNNDQKERKHD